MVTKKELGIIQKYAKLASKSWLYAVEWNENKEILQVANSKWKFLANKSFLFLQICMVLFNADRINKTIISKAMKDVSIGGKVINTFIFLANSTIALFHMSIAISRSDLAKLLNQITEFNNKLGKGSEPTKREFYIQFLQRFLALGVILACVIFCTTDFLYIVKITGNPLLGILFAILVFMNNWIAFIAYGMLHMYLFLFFATVYDTLPGIDQLSLDGHFLKETITNYNCLVMLCNYFNQACGKVAVPAIKYLLSILGMICFYATVRLRSQDKVVIGMEWAFLIIGIFLWCSVSIGANVMCNLWLDSSNFLMKLEQCCYSEQVPKTRKFFLSTIKSLQPLRLSVGGIYYMEKEAKLTLIAFLISGTVNLLLALK